MLALDARRFRPSRYARMARHATPVDPAALLVDAGEPASFPVAAPAPGASFRTVPVLTPAAPAAPAAPAWPSLTPTGEARLLRRVRRVVRRRLRVDLAGIAQSTVSDGELGVRLVTVSPRDPYLVEWSADRLVALVVLHDGCGARVLGGGGLMGRIELPSSTCAGAFLAFCYDAEPGAARI